MKTMKTFLVLALLALFTAQAQANFAPVEGVSFAYLTGGEDELTTMTIKVKKVVGSDKKAENLKADLMNVQGIKEVKACTESGTVTIAYNKAQVGCCSKIHTALKDGKWKYETVADNADAKANPGCAGKANGGACTKGQQKQCTGMKKGA